MQLVHDCYRTQEVCVTAVDTCPFIFDSVSDQLGSKQ